MGFTSSNQGLLLSKIASNNGHGEDSPYFDGLKAYDNDPFHATKNPHGVIQMGLSENQLCSDLIQEWIMRNPEASICTLEGVNKFKDIANFQDYHGLPEFRNAVAKFMGRVGGGRVTFDPNRIVMGGGATGANELLAFCLADRGDAFLVPSPYYPAFERDLTWRTGAQLIPVPCDSLTDFKITAAALESAYEKAKEANIRVKGMIITNPSNPLGTTLDKETLRSLVSFINQKNIHLVCEEIYAATVFGYPSFISVSEVIEQDKECNRDLVHIVYSLSKDMGLPGFRVGVVYSYNDAVVNCARKMSSFGLVSSQTQHLLATMLSDDEFVEKFLLESEKRLATRYNSFTEGLAQVGIGCLKSNSGLFCWMDLQKLLNEPSFEEEMGLWQVIINKVKLNVSPGSSFHCSEPGWFRVCIANMDDQTMVVALQRIRSFVRQGKEVELPAGKKKRPRSDLRVSLSFRRIEDPMIRTPHTMSPHSPIPQYSPPLLMPRIKWI